VNTQLQLVALEDRISPAVLSVNPRDPAAFHTIGSAIVAANPGDTVQVYPADYAENVAINKPLSLIGLTNNGLEPAIVGAPVVGAQQALVSVGGVSGVSVQGFQIKNATRSYNQTVIGILVAPGGCSVAIVQDVVSNLRDASVRLSKSAGTIGIMLSPGSHDVEIKNTQIDIQNAQVKGSNSVGGSSYGAFGIWINGAADCQVLYCYVNAADGVGIKVSGVSPGTAFDNNDVEPLVAGEPAMRVGLEVSNNAQVSGVGNEFTENHIGILATSDWVGSLVLTNTVLVGNDAAIIDQSSTPLQVT
jgi:hypothetical protein